MEDEAITVHRLSRKKMYVILIWDSFSTDTLSWEKEGQRLPSGGLASPWIVGQVHPVPSTAI